MTSGRRFKLLRFLQNFLNSAFHVEGLLRNIVVFAFNDLFEAADRIRDLHVLSRASGELRSNEERLRQELLNFAGAGNGEFILLAQLLYTQNGNDVLQVLIAL